MMQIVTAHKCGADVSCIQEGLVPTKYFEKTTHMVKSASGHALDIKYKLPNTRICQNKLQLPLKKTLKGSENYGIWRRSMTITLQAKRKLGFISGACKKDSVRDEHHEHWETYNALVLSWIMNTVAPSLLSGFVYASNVFLVWADLKERFDKVNRMRIYQLHIEINSINQGTSTVAEYFTRLKELWSEFDAVVHSPDCGCVKAYTLIIEDECQKGSILNTAPHSNAGGNDITTLWSARGLPQNHKKPHNEYWNEKCDFCKIKGHIKANCYRLIGYPPNYKDRKKEGIAANSSSLGDDSSHSKDNYDQYSGVPYQQTWSPYGSNGIRMH
ncbi:uncharacterized protein LOC125861289 [Solanum stenotomum]|uniref:uncharacterized protein LOC125861289 n=1 Tax=Solanum stenotomum TaxID=172797 RepID=UPI0020D0F09F|nr:uncharacterized protein LOC125861289 [Solanum stenotomum]